MARPLRGDTLRSNSLFASRTKIGRAIKNNPNLTPSRRAAQLTRARRGLLFEGVTRKAGTSVWHRVLWDGMSKADQNAMIGRLRTKTKRGRVMVNFLLTRGNGIWFSNTRLITNGDDVRLAYKQLVEKYEEGGIEVIGFDWKYL